MARGRGALTGTPSTWPTPSTVVLRAGALKELSIEEAAALAQDGVLIDNRPAPAYQRRDEGADATTTGHIPGAVNLPFTDLFDPDGRYRPVEELRSILDRAIRAARPEATVEEPADQVVGAYCGGGILSTQIALALALLGRVDDSAVFIGIMVCMAVGPASAARLRPGCRTPCLRTTRIRSRPCRFKRPSMARILRSYL